MSSTLVCNSKRIEAILAALVCETIYTSLMAVLAFLTETTLKCLDPALKRLQNLK